MFLLILLMSFGSFGLGRLSVQNTGEKAKIQKESFLVGVGNSASVSPKNGLKTGQNEKMGQVIASKNGSKYHDPWCPGASQISQGNKVIFESEDIAMSAGYTRASNCPK